MKRLRFLSWVLLFCLLFFVSACDRTEDPELPGRAEPSSKAPGPDGKGVWYMKDLLEVGYTFPIEGLYGQTQEARTQDAAIYAHHSGGPVGLDTGAGVLIDVLRVPARYDKNTGSLVSACTDPLCEHDGDRNGCIWSALDRKICRGGDLLIFTYTPEEIWEEWVTMLYDFDQMPQRLCVSDLNGNDVRELYQSEGGRIWSVTRCGDYLFILEERIDPETDEPVIATMRLPVEGGRAERILTNCTMFLPLNEGEKVLYVDSKDGDGDCYLYDPETEKQTLFRSGISLFASYRGWIYYNEDGCLWRTSETDLSLRQRVLEQTLWNTGDASFVADRIYYLQKSVFSESEKYGKYYQWELYSVALDGSDRKYVMRFERDGIPDRVRRIWTDGKMLLVQYHPYWDFDNEFVKNFIPSYGSSDYPATFALVDLSTGEQLAFYQR